MADNYFICLAEPRRNVSHESTRNEDPRSHWDKLPGGRDEWERLLANRENKLCFLGGVSSNLSEEKISAESDLA